MLHTLLLLTAPCWALQDDAQLTEWVRQLGDPEAKVREQAVEDLVKADARAEPLLTEALQSESAHVRENAAEALRRIARARLLKEIDVEARPFSLRFEKAEIPAILDEIQARSGIRIEMERSALQGAATLDLPETTAMEALDALCRGQENLTYEWKDAGHFRVMAGKHVPTPAAYWGPCKVWISSIEVQRTWNFQEFNVEAHLSVEVTQASRVKPLRRIRIEFEAGQDDTGRDIVVMSGLSRSTQGRGIPLFGGVPASFAYPFVVKGISPEAGALPRLTGKMTLFYPLAAVEVLFQAPSRNDTRESGEFKFTFAKTGKGYVDFIIEKAEGGVVPPDEVERRLESANVTVVDEDGVEHKADGVAPAGSGFGGIIVIMGGRGGGGGGGTESARPGTYRATFPNFKGGDVKTFKFRFADRTLERETSFEFKDVKLP
ncbi:MAG: HEAT repeat domain-containing protein [Planctomycetes bacterium]|nr:HEAT repeat domain-containing protein [Planctomycetota bacterium]